MRLSNFLKESDTEFKFRNVRSSTEPDSKSILAYKTAAQQTGKVTAMLENFKPLVTLSILLPSLKTLTLHFHSFYRLGNKRIT